MANELKLQLSIQHTKPPKIPYKPSPFQTNQTGTGVFSQTVPVGTAELNVVFGGIATPGLCVLENLHATNSVDWGKDNAGAMQPIGVLKPADFPAIFRFKPGETLRLKATGAATPVQITVYED